MNDSFQKILSQKLNNEGANENLSNSQNSSNQLTIEFKSIELTKDMQIFLLDFLIVISKCTPHSLHDEIFGSFSDSLAVNLAAHLWDDNPHPGGSASRRSPRTSNR